MVRRAVIGLGVALAVAGCGTTGSGSGSSSKSSSNSAVTATGATLSIWLSVPPNPSAAERDVVDAERLAFAAKSREVTRLPLRLRVASGSELSADARLAIQDKSAIAYLGEVPPGGSEDSVGITNALDLLQVSPTDTALELTQSTAAVPNSPARYYETLGTYGHTFARVAPSSAAEARAQVAEMKKLGVGSLCVGDDGSDYGRAAASAVSADAASSSISVRGCGAGVDAEFYGWQALAGRPPVTSGSTKLFLPSAAAMRGNLAGLSAGGGVYVSVPSPAAGSGAMVSSFEKAFATAYGHRPAPQAVLGYEAMAAVLSVLGQAGSSIRQRSVVVGDFHRISNRSSVLGSYSIDRDGDTSLNSFRFLKLKDGALVPLAGGPVQG